MASASTVIRVEGVSKRYGAIEAVRDLSFTVEPGSIFGLLGPNGSGKTTTIRLLLGFLRPESGSSQIFGEDSRRLSPACRHRIGYLSEEPFPYQSWSLVQVLRFVATFFPTWDWGHADALVKRFGVPTDRPLLSMSAGQRRLAELLLVLAQKPDLLILDDPAVGLDVMVRREFLWAALEVAREEGKAVLFTSHILTDVERVRDTVGILRKGRLRALAVLEDLKARTRRLVLAPEDAAALEGQGPLPGEVARRAGDAGGRDRGLHAPARVGAAGAVPRCPVRGDEPRRHLLRAGRATDPGAGISAVPSPACVCSSCSSALATCSGPGWTPFSSSSAGSAWPSR